MEKKGKETPKYKKKIDEVVYSRVYVDYSKKKPKISFDVPVAKQQEKTILAKGLAIILLLSFSVALIAAVYAVVYTPSFFSSRLMDNTLNFTKCDDLRIVNNTDGWFELQFECADDNRTYIEEFSYSRSEQIKIFNNSIHYIMMESDSLGLFINDKESIFFLPCFALLCLVVFGLIFFAFAWPFRKRIGSFMLRGDGKNVKPKYEITFKPKDVYKKKGEWVCDIPNFDNFYLDYDTFGDFNSLLKVKITDFPVYKIKKKDKKNKGGRSIVFWKAEFVFSKKPVKGRMVCRFK